jgi:aminomethyltransferase
VIGLGPGRQRYTLFTNTGGGILDDLMVSNQGDHLLLVVNAARKVEDEAHLRNELAVDCFIEPRTDHALVALQGPRSEEILAAHAPEVRAMRFMDARSVLLMGEACTVSRSGYTGEDGFEISIRAQAAEGLCEALLRDPAVAPVGLGARDTLRLEAGLCLYGSDLDESTTPVEAGLDWTIQRPRRQGGARTGGFPGAGIILGQLANGASRQRVGLKTEGRAPVRGGTPLFAKESDAVPAGIVCSGGFGPSLNVPIAMGYVSRDAATTGMRLFAEVRGRRLPAIISNLPFVPARYKRR